MPAIRTKTNRMRLIPIVPALQPWLEFFSPSIEFEVLNSGWLPARVKAEMPHVNFNDLRRFCAGTMLSVSVGHNTISKTLGHSSVQTTQRSAHLRVDAQRAARTSSQCWCKSRAKLDRKITQAKKSRPSEEVGCIVSN